MQVSQNHIPARYMWPCTWNAYSKARVSAIDIGPFHQNYIEHFIYLAFSDLHVTIFYLDPSGVYGLNMDSSMIRYSIDMRYMSTVKILC